jgi:hypothetical protein
MCQNYTMSARERQSMPLLRSGMGTTCAGLLPGILSGKRTLEWLLLPSIIDEPFQRVWQTRLGKGASLKHAFAGALFSGACF